jgi:protein-disulfide isomerase
MRLKHGWVIVVAVAVLLVAACAPQDGALTLSDQATAEDSSKPTVVGDAPTADEAEEATQEPSEGPTSAAALPVDEGDWHVLGSPEASVTIVEYSDFQ